MWRTGSFYVWPLTANDHGRSKTWFLQGKCCVEEHYESHRGWDACGERSWASRMINNSCPWDTIGLCSGSGNGSWSREKAGRREKKPMKECGGSTEVKVRSDVESAKVTMPQKLALRDVSFAEGLDMWRRTAHWKKDRERLRVQIIFLLSVTRTRMQFERAT